MVAETALVLPTLLLFTTLLLSGISALDAKFKCNQLAASIARAIERDEVAWPDFAREAMPEADIDVLTTDRWVTVVVKQKARIGIMVEGRAIALARV